MTNAVKSRGFLPDFYVSQATDLSAAWISEHGIKGLLLDIDNTLCRWELRQLPPEELAWLTGLTKAGIACRLLSNGLPVKVSRVVQQTGIDHVRGRPMKPLPWGFYRGVKELALEPQQVMMIGDSVIPDILGANRAGIWTCLVEPMSPIDFPGSKFWRLLERLFKLRHTFTKDGDLRRQ